MTVIDIYKKYIFIGNMKTGSMAITEWFRQFNPTYIFNTSINEGKHSTYLQIKQFLKDKNFNIDNFIIFFYIREPVNRLISCFNYETLNRKKDLKIWYKYSFQNTQIDFEKYINIEAHHFKRINEMIYDETNCIPKNIIIFRYELINESLNVISKLLNLNNNIKNLEIINKSSVYTKFNITNTIKEIIYNRYKLDAEYYL
jgi:hypothetical protein